MKKSKRRSPFSKTVLLCHPQCSGSHFADDVGGRWHTHNAAVCGTRPGRVGRPAAVRQREAVSSHSEAQAGAGKAGSSGQDSETATGETHAHIIIIVLPSRIYF